MKKARVPSPRPAAIVSTVDDKVLRAARGGVVTFTQTVVRDQTGHE